MPSSIAHIRSGKTRSFSVTSPMGRRPCPMSQQRPMLCPATRQDRGSASAPRKQLPVASSASCKPRFYRGRVFLLGACREHPRGMLKETREARVISGASRQPGLPCQAPPQPDSCPVQTARRMRGRLAVGLPCAAGVPAASRVSRSALSRSRLAWNAFCAISCSVIASASTLRNALCASRSSLVRQSRAVPERA